MNDADKIELKNGMDNTDKIKLKNCTIIDDVVICDMEREEYKKMKNPPDALEINLEDEVPKNKSTDGTKPTEENKSNDGTRSTEADSSNKQGCGCSITKNEIANFVAKFQIKKEEN